MNTRLKHRIEDSRIPKKNIRLFPQHTPKHNIFEVEELQQLPNGSFVDKKLVIQKQSGNLKTLYQKICWKCHLRLDTSHELTVHLKNCKCG